MSWTSLCVVIWNLILKSIYIEIVCSISSPSYKELHYHKIRHIGLRWTSLCVKRCKPIWNLASREKLLSHVEPHFAINSVCIKTVFYSCLRKTPLPENWTHRFEFNLFLHFSIHTTIMGWTLLHVVKYISGLNITVDSAPPLPLLYETLHFQKI